MTNSVIFGDEREKWFCS